MEVTFEKAKDDIHKLTARFYKDGKTKIISFGGKGYKDYPNYYKKDKTLANVKKLNYIARHSVREDHNDPLTAGALSRWILWNKPTIEESIQDFKHRFSLI